MGSEQSCPSGKVPDESSRVEEDPKTRCQIRQKVCCLCFLQQFEAIQRNRRSVLIALGCAVAQNMTAANSVIYFTIDIFRLAGVCDPLLPGVGIGVVKVRPPVLTEMAEGVTHVSVACIPVNEKQLRPLARVDTEIHQHVLQYLSARTPAFRAISSHKT